MKPEVNNNAVPLENITEQDYIDAAQKLGCEVNVIKAVAGVESGGSGFFKTGEVAILFEPHVFWRQLQRAHGIDPEKALRDHPGHEDVLYKKWKTFPYPPPDKRWDQLRKAAEININAAYESASFGKFQILGLHYKTCGYNNIFTFAHEMNLGEKYHLKAFVNFIKANGLDIHLKKKNWKAFASIYNGPGYRNSPNTVLDDYDYKLEKTYEKLCRLQSR
jgi:hypothetical protein